MSVWLASCGSPQPQPQASSAARPGSPLAPSPVIDANFWRTWGDGTAEVTGYDLTFPRYGQPRKGVAVTIFVSETFSNDLRVKADPGKHPKSDLIPVMKLNLLERFQTGVYDYHEMTSSFVALARANGHPPGLLTKVSFSGQEWSGITFQQLIFDPSTIRTVQHSYFDGDGDERDELSYPANGISADQLMLWARGMAAPVLQPGETRDVMMLPTLQSARHAHTPLTWHRALLTRSAENSLMDAWSAKYFGGPTLIFHVDKAPPHAIRRWESTDGEHAEMLSAARMKYWELHNEGDETALARLGLTRRPPGTP